MILELNHCLEEILRANSGVKTAADLATKYRKNVQYNLEASLRAVAASEAAKVEPEEETKE
jgi:DASH complex subunit DAD4